MFGTGGFFAGGSRGFAGLENGRAGAEPANPRPQGKNLRCGTLHSAIYSHHQEASENRSGRLDGQQPPLDNRLPLSR